MMKPRFYIRKSVAEAVVKSYAEACLTARTYLRPSGQRVLEVDDLDDTTWVITTEVQLEDFQSSRGLSARYNRPTDPALVERNNILRAECLKQADEWDLQEASYGDSA